MTSRVVAFFMLSAIIPAYNEEKTIADVVAVCLGSNLIDELLVVDDGSRDNTAREAIAAGARVIKLPKNKGKGEAMTAGAAEAKGDILFFLDADLKDFSKEHIRILAQPVLAGECDMTVGMIDRLWLERAIISPFSGMRIMRRSFWDEVPAEFKRGFFIESAITHFAKKKRLRVKGFMLKNLKHAIKEKKRGIVLGLWERIRMITDIIFINFYLKVFRR